MKKHNGSVVTDISSLLRPTIERSAPVKLAANMDCSFQGCVLAPNDWFVLTLDEGQRLLAANAQNSEVVRPFLGGDEVNSDSALGYERYVFDFAEMTLAEAERWPDLLELVRTRSKLMPSNTRKKSTQPWWQFWRARPELRRALAPLDRCLVTSEQSTHLRFAFQQTDRVFSHKLYVFPMDAYSAFAVLQSRVHFFWARLPGLSRGAADTAVYAPTECFESFSFPHPDPRSVIDSLEAVGERVYERRAAFMLETDQGLTKIYSALRDPGNDDFRVVELRSLHEQMDRAVLDAYGWTDISVPSFCQRDDEDRTALQAFEHEVIDRLYALNAERAAEEVRLGLHAKGRKQGTAKRSTKKTAKKRIPRVT